MGTEHRRPSLINVQFVAFREEYTKLIHLRGLIYRFYDILPESEEYVQKLQNEIYRLDPQTQSAHGLQTELDPHRLGLLYMIHGLGYMLDLDKEPYCTDAWTCLDFAKACLAVRPVLDFPSISSIQTMVSLFIFLLFYFILILIAVFNVLFPTFGK
jgi:hypothetical protein